MHETYGDELLWLVAGEYAITPVDHVAYPNRVLREAGLLSVREGADGEYLDLAASRAWALADHQFSHVFVADGDARTIDLAAEVFRNQPGIAEVLVGAQRGRYGLDHPRSGELILISEPNSWQAYYYWLADGRGARFCPHGRYPSQAGLRPGRVARQHGHAEHPAGRHADPRLARGPGGRSRPTHGAFGFEADPARRADGGGYRRVRDRDEAVRGDDEVIQPRRGAL